MFKGLSNLANLGSIIKQAQEVGGKLQGINEELKGRRVTGTAGGGLVTTVMSNLGLERHLAAQGLGMVRTAVAKDARADVLGLIQEFLAPVERR